MCCLMTSRFYIVFPGPFSETIWHIKFNIAHTHTILSCMSLLLELHNNILLSYVHQLHIFVNNQLRLVLRKWRHFENSSCAYSKSLQCWSNGDVYIGSLPIRFCKIVLHDLLHVGKPQDTNMYTACSDT